MKLSIDTDAATLTWQDQGQERTIPLYTDEAFELLNRQWLRLGWNQKYVYCFSWFGRPLIQLPEDVIRAQEVIWRLQPDVIVETGIAHGGSLIFYASLCKAIGRGRVIGIDIEIRPHNRKAIEAHPLFPMLTLIEGSSTDPGIVAQARSLIQPGETVLVILDSCHTREHVTRELEAYHSLVSPGSYIVATDGIMEDLSDVPRGQASWGEDNPSAAARDFVKARPEFVLEQPAWPFNESTLKHNITHWPQAWLKRTK